MKIKMGWNRDLPDFRDLNQDAPQVQAILSTAAPKTAPATVDLRQWCSPIDDQGQLGSCTAMVL